MGYTKNTWRDGPTGNTPINAAALSHMEDGIFGAAAVADSAASAAAAAAPMELQHWIANEPVAALEYWWSPDNTLIVRAASGTTRATWDATEKGNWFVVGAGGGSGTVSQVNGKNPDGSGHVTLVPADIGAATASAQSATAASLAALSASLGTASTLAASAVAQTANNGSDFADAGSTRYNLRINTLVTAQCVAITNQALTGLPTIDGYTLLNGDVVLLAGQTTASQNGPWQMPATGTGAWIRPNDYPAAGSVKARSMKVRAGTIYKATEWTCLTAGSVVIDTTATTWQITGGSYFQGILNDGGAITQWVTSTPATAQSVWGYQGGIYMRNTTGTDSVFTRANWTLLGADPTVAAGGELGCAILGTSQVLSATPTPQDVPGLNISPVIPSSGRGIYVELISTFSYALGGKQAHFLLYDVTAGALASPDISTTYEATAGVPINVIARWRLAPAGGARTYKIQCDVQTAASVTVFGEDLQAQTGLYCIAR